MHLIAYEAINAIGDAADYNDRQGEEQIQEKTRRLEQLNPSRLKH